MQYFEFINLLVYSTNNRVLIMCPALFLVLEIAKNKTVLAMKNYSLIVYGRVC